MRASKRFFASKYFFDDPIFIPAKKGFITSKTELTVSCHPTVAKKGSIKADLKQGSTYYWCSCGKSASQPFCDGSHEGSDFKPLMFEWKMPDKPNASICGCKLN